jgi:hypothetical protein
MYFFAPTFKSYELHPQYLFIFPQISPNLYGYPSFGDQIVIKGEIEAQKLSDFMGNSTRYIYKCTFESQIIILVVLTTNFFFKESKLPH